MKHPRTFSTYMISRARYKNQECTHFFPSHLLRKHRIIFEAVMILRQALSLTCRSKAVNSNKRFARDDIGAEGNIFV